MPLAGYEHNVVLLSRLHGLQDRVGAVRYDAEVVAARGRDPGLLARSSAAQVAYAGSDMHRRLAVIAAVAVALAMVGCDGEGNVDRAVHTAPDSEEGGGMRLTSEAFADQAVIPAKYTCDGQDVSPQLTIADIPAGTATLALIMDDPDAPGGTWDQSILNAERSSLNAGGSTITDVTYPRFITKPDGDMIMTYRTGGSGNGNMNFATYGAGGGLWDTPHQIINGTDLITYTDILGSSDNRNAYLNGLNIGPGGNIHITWTWRESAGTTAMTSPVMTNPVTTTRAMQTMRVARSSSTTPRSFSSTTRRMPIWAFRSSLTDRAGKRSRSAARTDSCSRSKTEGV